MSQELMSAIRENAKKEAEEDDLDSFNEEHQAIVSGSDVFLSSKPKMHKGRQLSTSENDVRSNDSKTHSVGKTKIKNRNNVYTVRKNKLSISIEDDKSLSISIEEEIDTKNINREEEELIFFTNHSNRLFEDENSIKDAIKEYETLLSDDMLTYSLTNTLKTVENLEGQLSDFKRKSSVNERLNNSNKKFKDESEQKLRNLSAFEDRHHSFESSGKFSNLNPDTQSDHDDSNGIYSKSSRKYFTKQSKLNDGELNSGLASDRGSKVLMKSLGLITELKSEINSIVNSADYPADVTKKVKASNVLELLKSLQSSLFDHS